MPRGPGRRTVGPVYILTLSYIDDLGLATSTVGWQTVKPRIMPLYMAVRTSDRPRHANMAGRRPEVALRKRGAHYSYRHAARRALSPRPLAVVMVTSPTDGRTYGWPSRSIEPTGRHVDCVVISHVTAN